ncbi:hypothetical protein T484DRAFT_1607883, partial [Baffinella frigidus]
LGSRVSGFGSRVSGLGFRVSGFGSRVSGLGFRVSGLGFRVSGLGFRVSSLGWSTVERREWAVKTAVYIPIRSYRRIRLGLDFGPGRAIPNPRLFC